MAKKKGNKTILIIEDEAPLLKSVGHKFEIRGFDVLTATTTEEGLDILKNTERVDVIWLDHYIFGKEPGLLFVSGIKNDSKLKAIPIFVVSNASGPEKKKAYLALGINKYFTKIDYRLETICNEIESFLKK